MPRASQRFDIGVVLFCLRLFETVSFITSRGLFYPGFGASNEAEVCATMFILVLG